MTWAESIYPHHEPAADWDRRRDPGHPGGDQIGNSRDFDIPLSQLSTSSGGGIASNIVFPAGCMTIISTDPNCLATGATQPVIMASKAAATTVYYAPVLYFAGTTTRADSSSSPYPASVRYYAGKSKDTNGNPPGDGARVKVADRTGSPAGCRHQIHPGE